MTNKDAIEKMSKADKEEALRLASELIEAIESGKSWNMGEALAALTAFLEERGV